MDFLFVRVGEECGFDQGLDLYLALVWVGYGYGVGIFERIINSHQSC